MTQADSVLSTPRITAPESSPEQALHEQLKAAGMRLDRIDRKAAQPLPHHTMIIDHQDADELSPGHAPMMTATKAASYPVVWGPRARQPSVALNAAPAAAQAT